MPREKSKQLLAYILKINKHATAYNLMRLSYLIDFIIHEKRGYRVSSFNYRLLSFGPFDESIFDCLEYLIRKRLIHSHAHLYGAGLEVVTYAYNDRVDDVKFKNEVMPDISLSEFYSVRDILYELYNYSEEEITAMVYKTKPVKALGVCCPGDYLASTVPLSFSEHSPLAVTQHN
jgi:hypothetical protein